MSHNSQNKFDDITGVTSNPHWMTSPQCISCLTRGLDIKDCPFYNVCPSCGSCPDTHGEHCPFKNRGSRSFSFFRIHPVELGKRPWWKSLDLWEPSLRSFIPDPKGPDPLRMLLHPYPDFPPRTTLPMHELVIRAAWDNECKEYGITDPPDPPSYIRSVSSASASRKRQTELRTAVSERLAIHSKLFKPTCNAENDEKPLGSFPNHSTVEHQGSPRDFMARRPPKLRNVPMSLVAPGLRSGAPEFLTSDLVWMEVYS